MSDDFGISVSEHEGKLVVDSRLIAEQLGIEHESFLRTLDTYQSQIEQAFGVLRFEIGKPPRGSKGGRPPRFGLLTEDQATFVMTLSRNTPEVVRCKIALVVAFSKAKDLLARRQPKPAQIPYWYQRIQIAMSDGDNPLQAGYFCVYQEIMGFFAELETRFKYIIKDYDDKTGKYLVPDISIGQGFNRFLRDESEMATFARQQLLGVTDPIDFREGGVHEHEAQKYNHVYPKVSHGEYQVQPARSYPNKYLEIFRYYLQEYWIPDRCAGYLVERDPQGIAGVQSQINVMSSAERNALSVTLTGKLISSLFSLPPQR
jgi:phage regulator Rha-like protein